jgi:hypothetical protein
MAQTMPMDSAYVRAQAEKCNDQYSQCGTIAAVRKCPFLAEVAVGIGTDGTDAPSDCGLLVRYHMAPRRAIERDRLTTARGAQMPHGTTTAGGNCPTLAEAAVVSGTGGDAATGEPGKSIVHRVAFRNAEKPAPPARTQCPGIKLRPEIAPQFWATMEALKVASEWQVTRLSLQKAKFDAQLAKIADAQLAEVADPVAATCALANAASARAAVVSAAAAGASAVNRTVTKIAYALHATLTIANEGDGRACIAFEAMSELPEQASGGSGGIPPVTEAQQHAWESADAGDRFWLASQQIQLTWTKQRRIHRALGRTYPSNDTGPCK